MNDVEWEHRITQLESTVANSTQASEQRQTAMMVEIGKVAGTAQVISTQLAKINGTVARHNEEIASQKQTLGRFSGVVTDAGEAKVLIQQNRELWADFNQRKTNRDDRRWGIPVLVSVPSALVSVASLGTLIYIVLAGR